MGEYTHSDLAMESETEGVDGVRISEGEGGGCRIFRVQIKSPAAAEQLRKPMGHYVTLECGALQSMETDEMERVRCALAVEIRTMAERMCGRRIKQDFTALVVGLGNADLTADAVGVHTVRRLAVTRHLHRKDQALFSAVGLCELAAIAPGVPARTGVETLEVIKGAAMAIEPDLIVAVDALAARHTARLGATVQLSDTGIVPGSGVGRGSLAVDRSTVGVPVMALGVPTVVESATLVSDMLCKAGLKVLAEELHSELKASRGFFVSPKDVDLLTATAAVLLASSIEKAFSVVEPPV